MNQQTLPTNRLDRRQFLKTAGALTAGLGGLTDVLAAAAAATARDVVIRDLRIEKGVAIEASDGTRGFFAGSGGQDLATLADHLPRLRERWIGRNPLDPKLEGDDLWEAVYPGRARMFAEGRDPLTGAVIANRPRGSRQTKTGQVFMAFSAVDIALWDLRGRLLGKPVYRVMGAADRGHVLVYWRPGEATHGLDDARRRAREAFDAGYRHQKWYFTKSAKDGEAGFKENVELVRVLREELGPDARLMFDNHSIRQFDEVDYSVRLCRAVAPYRPFWIEEPVCPEHVDGYARIKGETGVPLAGGEHLYTRWPVKAFLDRKCLDFVQSDPVWCGGISEWLRVCELVRGYPGVKVVPHITSPWLAAPHCVASQPESLCPLLEFNYEGGRKSLEGRMSRRADGHRVMELPSAPGLS
jgi:L-alanine-DL-glutamate epimerase-like enolase superfamily enzyme